jgi:DNA-binding winged helix-turn-helix (wHTH) protein
MRYRFGPYELDEDAGELRRSGEPVEIQPKPLALLQLLVRERERVVPAHELLDALWPGVAVTPGSLTRAVSLARRAIGDGHRGSTLRSYSRRGYRFCGEVAVIDRSAAPRAGPHAADAGGADPFIGREDALATLRDAWQRAAAGRGGLVLLEGPPGIGKTRLAELFVAELARSGALVLVGRAREGEGVPAFWPWAQLLRRLTDEEGASAELRDLAARSDEIAGLCPELAPREAHRAPREAHRAPRPELAPEQSRFLFFDAVTRVLRHASRHRPLAIVLEDLQWAGSPALRLLEHLVFEAVGDALLVLATVRDEPRERGHPLERTLPALLQQPGCARIALRGFSRREVAALLERRLGRPAPADLASELVARTEGVPLFVREAVRLLAERGDLQHPERIRRWAVSLPEHALDLIRRPLGRLSPRAAELVGAAAVIGREFPLALAASVAGIAREEALDLLDEAEAAGILHAAPDAAATWRFAHALFQEAAYEGIAAGRRARMHQQVARELERRHGDDPERVLAELAHHHHEALAVGDPERAFAVAVRAAQRARRLGAFEQAAAHQAQALAAVDHAERLDAERRLATLLDLGDALGLAGERDRRRAVFAEAMEGARALGRPLAFARAAAGFCDLAEWAPRDDEARAALEEALAALPGGADAERVRLLSRLAYLSARDDVAGAEPRAREAVTRARSLGDPGLHQDAAYVLHFLLAGPDHLDERAALAGEVLELARGATARDTALITVLDWACDRLTLGDAAGAAAKREEAAEVAGPHPHPGRVWHLRVFDAGLACLEGRLDEAARLAEEASRVGRRIAHPYARGVDRALGAWLARERGDHAEVLRIFDPQIPIRRGPVQWVQAFCARALVAVGREAEARAFYEDLAATGFERIARNIRWHGTLVEVAHLCAELGDADRARALVALLAPVEHHHGVLPMPICYGGPVARCLARLHELLGRAGEAEELYAEALDACEALGARPMRARILVELGSLLARRHPSRGRERLAEGARLAGELGMEGVAARARDVLERR